MSNINRGSKKATYLHRYVTRRSSLKPGFKKEKI